MIRFGVIAVALVLAGCAGTASSTTAVSTPTAGSTASSVVVATTTAAGSSTTVAPTTTVDSCAPEAVVALAARMAEDARLAPSGDWAIDDGASTFVPAVVDPEDFAGTLGLDCSTRLVTDPAGPAERLLLAAWTGERTALVVLTVDGPSTPYEEAARFDLLFEQPWGEWVTNETWAVTISTGESVVLHTDDYPIGAVAKSFLVTFPEPTSPPPTLDAEEVAFEVLAATGASNIGIAEPSDTDVAAVVFTSPAGNVMIATVGPVPGFDPLAGYLTGKQSVEIIRGVEVTLTLPGPDQYTVAEAGFVCGDWGWRLESGFGTPDELLLMADAILDAGSC